MMTDFNIIDNNSFLSYRTRRVTDQIKKLKIKKVEQ